MKKYSVFAFNHIDKLLKQEEFTTLKEFYKYYHKKFWCYKKTFKHLISLMKVLPSLEFFW